MYFWDHRSLAQDLHKDTVKESQAIVYLIGLVIIDIFAKFGAHESHELIPIIALAFDVILILCLYYINKRGDNQNFIARYVILQFPVTIKVIILGLLFAVLLITALDPGPAGINLIFLILMVFVIILEIVYMVQGIRITSGHVDCEAAIANKKPLKKFIIGVVVYLILLGLALLLNRAIYNYYYPQLKVDNAIVWQITAGKISVKGKANNIAHIAFLGDKNLLAAGSQGIFNSKDDGKTWQLLKPGKTVGFRKMNDKAVALFIENKQEIVASFDVGKSWKTIQQPKQGIYKIYPITQKNYLATLKTGPIVQTFDGGKTWQGTSFSNPSIVNSEIMIVDDKNAYVLFGTDYARIDSGYKTKDGGKSWIQIPFNDLPDKVMRRLKTIYSLNGNTLYVATWNQMFKSTNSGVDWTSVNTRGIEFGIKQIILTNENTIYVLTDYHIYRSKDGGKNWVELGKWPFEVQATSMIITDDGTLYVSTDWSKIYKSEKRSKIIKQLDSTINNE